MTTWKGDSIRSITIDYDDLGDFMGRNPSGVYRQENLVKAVQDAIERGGEVYFRQSPDDRLHQLSPESDDGSFRLGPTAEPGQAATGVLPTRKA